MRLLNSRLTILILFAETITYLKKITIWPCLCRQKWRGLSLFWGRIFELGSARYVPRPFNHLWPATFSDWTICCIHLTKSRHTTTIESSWIRAYATVRFSSSPHDYNRWPWLKIRGNARVSISQFCSHSPTRESTRARRWNADCSKHEYVSFYSSMTPEKPWLCVHIICSIIS